MTPTLGQLKAISRLDTFPPKTVDNMTSVVHALELYGIKVGLDLPHRLAHFIAQLSHESGAFKYDKEIWGDTPAQIRYDTRTDLGNTPARDGDGRLYMGRSGIQLTGKGNYIAFTKWAKEIDPDAPDFVANPNLVNTDPWEGLAPIWFWDEGNSTGKSLNKYADVNDIETITKRINGGMNGFSDRVDYYVKTSLIFLGYSVARTKITESIKDFQRKSKLKDVDGDPGPRTRSALHEALIKTHKQVVEHFDIPVAAAPVTETIETETQVAVAPKGVEKSGKDIWSTVTAAAAGIGLGNISAGGIVEGAFGLNPTVQLALIALLGLLVVGGIGYFVISRLSLAREAKEIKAEVKAFNKAQ